MRRGWKDLSGIISRNRQTGAKRQQKNDLSHSPARRLSLFINATVVHKNFGVGGKAQAYRRFQSGDTAGTP